MAMLATTGAIVAYRKPTGLRLLQEIQYLICDRSLANCVKAPGHMVNAFTTSRPTRICSDG